MPKSAPLALLTLLLTACGPAAAPQGEPARIALEETGPQQAQAFPSPDTSDAFWTVADNGQAIRFGIQGEPPLLTLACDLGDAAAPQFRIIRHAEALPGQSALFPFIGNGMTSRFLADTVLVEGEWRWEAQLPVADPQLDIFAGNREMTATLPGRGMLEFKGSRIPGEFLVWCRNGGRAPVVVDDAGAAGDTREIE